MKAKRNKKKNPPKSQKNTNETTTIKVTAEALKNGTVLCALILRFLHDRSRENMFSVLSCLKDSDIWIPAVISMNGQNVDTLGLQDNGIMQPVKGRFTVRPQIIKTKDEKLIMPIYSRRENIKPENIKGFSVANLPYTKCLEMLEGIEGCNEIIVDPYLYNLLLDEDLIKISQKLPSQLGINK